MVWFLIIIVVFSSMGFMDQYMSVGPNVNLKFMNIVVDTWSRWAILMGYTLISNVIQIYTSDVIYPWVVTQVQNTMVPLEYSKSRTISMVLLYNFSVTFGSFLGVYIMFTQVDFLLATLTAQVTTNAITTYLYIKSKSEHLPI